MNSLFLGLAMVGVMGCSSKSGDGPAASASAGAVKATCEDSGRRYGEFAAKMMIADPKNPVPADKRKLLADPIRDATVKSCQEDKWDDLPLGCLASVFNNPPKDDETTDKYTDVCIKSVGKEKLDKMDQRVARAMADAVLPPAASATPSAAPVASGAAAPAASSGAAASGAAASGPAPTSAPASTPPPTPAGGANKGAAASPAPKPPAPKPPSRDDAF